MKRLIYILSITLFFTISCNEQEWLEEKAFDFNSANNSFTNEEQFESAVARLYENIEPYKTFWPPFLGNAFIYTSDIAYDAIAITHQLNSYDDKLIAETELPRRFWQEFYNSIFDANVIIGRIEEEGVTFSSEAKRQTIIAEARFFRAFYYRYLGILYGGVPLVLEELKEPKRDFVRATEEQVWDQCISDLTFAVQNLPEVASQDGRVTSAAANHLLAEVYIIKKEYDKAIAAASSIINSSNYGLMTNRFGTKASEPGDVYGDLFRRGNQNRNGGVNRESIWVKQYEYNTVGGGQEYRLTWVYVPNYKLLKGDSDGKSLFIGPTSQNGGGGAGWGAPTDYLLNDVWASDPNDMRNSEHNIIRDIIADNPESDYYGQKIVESGAIDNFPNTLSRWWSAIFAKTTPINDFPKETFLDEETGLVSNLAENTFRDHYIFRLAETYLLRAEAHYLKGDLASAAADINAIRDRANATPVTAGEVDIDYILDERARELHFENPRLLTLMRTGKLVERVKLHDPMHNGKYANHGISPRHAKWPIPQSEIEKNTEAVLEQNPGY
ncbi:RagB/SusD family nutrient uptake outer membrane protein [Flagellimonas sp.]|uniref:RagB/SusD family nutrient uptake outer membrane protein n=1 Tax=Flagellimonas sp. TaxID=2058762 RepID=UPI003B51172E